MNKRGFGLLYESELSESRHHHDIPALDTSPNCACIGTASQDSSPIRDSNSHAIVI